jgi:hypothetical protein
MSFWVTKWKQITAAAVGVVAIGAALALFEVELPKFANPTLAKIEAHARNDDKEFSELRAEIMRVAQLATQSTLESVERRKGEMRILIQQMDAARAACAKNPDCDESLLDPAPLRAQVRNLERQTEGLEADLRGIKGQ